MHHYTNGKPVGDRHYFWANRILVSYQALRRPANALVDFTYFNVKTYKESVKEQLFTFEQAIQLAERRREDKRYKNFKFIID